MGAHRQMLGQSYLMIGPIGTVVPRDANKGLVTRQQIIVHT